MRVKNPGRTAQGDQGSSWLAFWERVSAQNAFMCFAAGCINTPSAGGLVQEEGPTDGPWYVVPLCSQCSKAPVLDIWEPALLVCANANGALIPAEAGRAPAARRAAPGRRHFSLASGR